MISQKDLIKEEQQELDQVIDRLDKLLLNLHNDYTEESLSDIKDRCSCLPEAYGELISALHEYIIIRDSIRELYEIRDELYDTHLIVEYKDYDGEIGVQDLKIGLHSYIDPYTHKNLIITWKMPVCRHYLLDNSSTEYANIVKDRLGSEYKTFFKLKMKRRVELFFDKVKSVSHLFPIDDIAEYEEIIADEFLKELLSRRDEKEFRNIVFSIQKHQGEIIQKPFEQSLIVQGCAGSGKSMIMLHRLPILLYDNPDNLDNNNLFIVTPSLAYIQMAKKMMFELEISHLRIGTINQYYDHVIRKYGSDPSAYGQVRSYLNPDPVKYKYVYSKKCVKDVNSLIIQQIHSFSVDLESAYRILGIEDYKRSSNVPYGLLQNELLRIQALISENETRLRCSDRLIKGLLDELADTSRILSNRKNYVLEKINSKIFKEQKKITSIQEQIDKNNGKNRNRGDNSEKKYMEILVAENKIKELEKVLQKVKEDDDYFNSLKYISKKIDKVRSDFPKNRKGLYSDSVDDHYNRVELRNTLLMACFTLPREIEMLEDPYCEYLESFDKRASKLESCVEGLNEYDKKILPKEKYYELKKAHSSLDSKDKTIISDVYHTIMKNIGIDPGKQFVFECAPYLYLQTLYTYYGPPKSVFETLISIDEAQNISLEEYKLIKNINGGKVVFNLYGDAQQHVEGTRGLDTWEVISEIADFEVQEMNENYRNAKQITEYCNQTFGLNMRAINLEGAGVHIIHNQGELNKKLRSVFKKPMNAGLSAIIVKDVKEARTFTVMYEEYHQKIHNITEEISELDTGRWNLMTVDQVKGLEFESVISISGRMSNNERYISYTRALDELYVCKYKLPIIEMKSEDIQKKNAKTEKMKSEHRKERKKRKSKM